MTGKETILEVLEVKQGRRIRSEDQWVEHLNLISSWWETTMLLWKILSIAKTLGKWQLCRLATVQAKWVPCMPP